MAELEKAWPEGAHVVYIGKAAASANGRRHLRKRVKEFRQHGYGRAVAHQGGPRIWQLADAGDFVSAWITTGPRDPEDLESDLLRAFVSAFGTRPIGNRTVGRRPPVATSNS